MGRLAKLWKRIRGEQPVLTPRQQRIKQILKARQVTPETRAKLEKYLADG